MKFSVLRTVQGALLCFFACQLASPPARAATAANCIDAGVERILEARHVLTYGCMTPFGGMFYFAAYEVNSGVELWRSDRTEAGTLLVGDLYAGPGDSVPNGLTEFAGRLWFQATDAAHGAELWSSDGTARGTRLEADISPGPTSSWPASFTDNGGGVLFFSATRPIDGRELWAYRMSDSQPHQVADIYSGAQGSNPFYLTVLNGTLYFTATDPLFGTELWVSDGITASLFEDLVPGPGGSSPYNLEASQGALHFDTYTDGSGVRSFVSNGIRGNTLLAVKPTNQAVLSWQAPLTNEDGSPLLDLASYLIYYWSDAEPRMKVFSISARTGNSYTFKDLPPDNYYFKVTAMSADGRESLPAATVSKRIL